MKRKTARKNSNVAKVIQILLFTTVIVVCITFSKYKTALGGKATAIIGNPKTTVVDEVVFPVYFSFVRMYRTAAAYHCFC